MILLTYLGTEERPAPVTFIIKLYRGDEWAFLLLKLCLGTWVLSYVSDQVFDDGLGVILPT